MGSPQTAEQALFGADEEVFQDIVGACHERHDSTVGVAHHRMAAEVLAIAIRGPNAPVRGFRASQASRCADSGRL